MNIRAFSFHTLLTLLAAYPTAFAAESMTCTYVHDQPHFGDRRGCYGTGGEGGSCVYAGHFVERILIRKRAEDPAGRLWIDHDIRWQAYETMNSDEQTYLRSQDRHAQYGGQGSLTSERTRLALDGVWTFPAEWGLMDGSVVHFTDHGTVAEPNHVEFDVSPAPADSTYTGLIGRIRFDYNGASYSDWTDQVFQCVYSAN